MIGPNYGDQPKVNIGELVNNTIDYVDLKVSLSGLSILFRAVKFLIMEYFFSSLVPLLFSDD